MARDMIVSMHTLNVDFYPRETRVATFRDPYSFPILFHPACNNLVREHLGDLARKVGNPCHADMQGHWLLTTNRSCLFA